MSKKKEFNQGLEVGIRISEEFMKQKVEENHILMEKMNHLTLTHEGLNESIQQILNYNEEEAIERYYGICNRLSPKDLPEAEKYILLDVLATIFVNSDDLNRDQKQFFSNVKRYVQLSNYNPNTKYDFEKIENVRDLDFQMIIFKCIREFLFLKYCDFSFVEEYEELFDVFDIKTKRVRNIDDIIDLTFYMFGKSGIVEMYGSHTLINSYDLGSGEDTPDIRLKKEIINKKIIINKNEEIVFKNKAIYFRADIECDGKIVFENCHLHYYEPDITSQMFIGSNSIIEFNNCTMKSYMLNEVDSYRDRKYFIVYKGSSYSGCNKVDVHNCIFDEASYFLNCEEGKRLRLNKNELINSYALFKYRGDDSVITNCYISCKKIPEYIKSNINNIPHELNAILDINSAKYMNCCFIGAEEFIHSNGDDYGCDLIEGAKEILNCTFINLNNYIYAPKLVACIFENCRNVYDGNAIFSIVSSKEKHISDCLFNKCSKILAVGENAIIEQCQFVECEKALISAKGKCTIDSCGFYNIAISEDLNKGFGRIGCKGMYGIAGTAILLNGRKGSDRADIKNCEFNGIKVEDEAYLIEIDAYEKLSNYIGLIDNCKLINVHNESGDLCKKTYHYYGIFNKRHIETGLYIPSNFENYNKGDGICNTVPLKEIDIYGKPIGASKDVVEGISGKIARYIYQDALVV